MPAEALWPPKSASGSPSSCSIGVAGLLLADTFGDFERAGEGDFDLEREGEGDFDLEREGEGDFDFRGVLRVDVAPIRGKVRCHQICCTFVRCNTVPAAHEHFQTGVR